MNIIYKVQIITCILVLLGLIEYMILTNNLTQQDIAKFITAYIVATGISFIILNITINVFEKFENKISS